jgi:hypothetical protein
MWDRKGSRQHFREEAAVMVAIERVGDGNI